MSEKVSGIDACGGSEPSSPRRILVASRCMRLPSTASASSSQDELETSYCSQVVDSSEAFSEQLSELYLTKHFTDLTLDINYGRQRLQAHKFLLALRSSVFRAMLMGSWREREDVEIKLEEEEEACVQEFPIFLSYLYTGNVTLTLLNVKPLYMLANKYDISCLEDAAASYILHNIATKQCNQATTWWQVAQLHNNISMAEKCEKFIIDNFETVCHSSAWFEVSRPNLIHLLRQCEVVVQDEYQVYCAAERWLVYHAVEPADMADILAEVRFHLIRPQHLMAIEQDSSLYKTFPDVISSYLQQAYRFQCIAKEIRVPDFLCSYPNAQPRLYTNSEYSYGFSVYENMAMFTTTLSASSADQNKWKWQIVSAPFIRERMAYNRSPNITAPSMFALTRQVLTSGGANVCSPTMAGDDVNIVLVTSHRTPTMRYKRVWNITDTANWDKNVVRFRLPEPIVKKLQAKASIPVLEVKGEEGGSGGAGASGPGGAGGGEHVGDDVNSSDDEQIQGNTSTLKMKKCQFRIILLPKQP